MFHRWENSVSPEDIIYIKSFTYKVFLILAILLFLRSTGFYLQLMDFQSQLWSHHKVLRKLLKSAAWLLIKTSYLYLLHASNAMQTAGSTMPPTHLYLCQETGWRHRIQVWSSIPSGKCFPWYLWLGERNGHPYWEVIYSFFSNTGYSSTGYTSTAAEICGQLHFKKKIQVMPPQTFVLETPFLDAGSTFVGFAVPNCWICHSFSANCNNAFGGHSLGSALN